MNSHPKLKLITNSCTCPDDNRLKHFNDCKECGCFISAGASNYRKGTSVRDWCCTQIKKD